jgi:AcrR family transcriptional regulator
MDDIGNFVAPSMPALPAPLAEALLTGHERLPKRERTRAQLIQAAIQVFSARGVAQASIQEIAQVAGMTTGTVYNHFATREEIVDAVAVWLATTLCRRIDQSYAQVTDAAERMAIGLRRYQWLAEVSPHWTLLILQVSHATPSLAENIRDFCLSDLRMGVRQERFAVPSEEAAMDLIFGANQAAITRIALGLAPDPQAHGIATATLILRGLGMDPEEARTLATRPLPEFTALSAPAPAARRSASARRAR